MKSGTVSLETKDLEGILTVQDLSDLAKLRDLYDGAMGEFKKSPSSAKQNLVEIFNSIGSFMRQIVARLPEIKIYSFETPQILHGEASRIIARMRDERTGQSEFTHLIQRSYQMLCNLAFGVNTSAKKNYVLVPTPVKYPVQNFAIHKIPDMDPLVNNSVMCVLLRGALLPSMIMSKEIEDLSSEDYITPFALFRIKRNDNKTHKDMEYILDLSKSYFDFESLQDKDLIFADPMNATSGSLVTIIRYLLDNGVRPRSIKVFTVISAMQGALQLIRAVPNVTLYTLWMDPVLNEKAFIMPGLGDAGDRLNGVDSHQNPRSIIQLLGDYGSTLLDLYRSQVRQIEKTVLG